jgi:hypothetical protein
MLKLIFVIKKNSFRRFVMLDSLVANLKLEGKSLAWIVKFYLFKQEHVIYDEIEDKLTILNYNKFMELLKELEEIQKEILEK